MLVRKQYRRNGGRKAVAEAVKAEPGVVFSTDYQYMCSENGQALFETPLRSTV